MVQSLVKEGSGIGEGRKGGGVAVGPDIQCSWEIPDTGVL
jgi:hypothetical protein